ncbi:hypothetical protein [Mycolicibacterium sp. 050158]|uniref:hypothetical protein n=1 Tax=Mycolicibacterium sp. 050158 TaxID=3090602 RepID=UPI00299E6786|nr:hypothetical protein [Mycolicibacterium sp. 050158]MDX1890720.1 hypothetical protein [Mycolicibacterium sp. 050158]
MTEVRWEHLGDRASARRAAVRSLHPDVGGDADRLVAALAAIDRRFGVQPGGPGRSEPDAVVIRRSRLSVAWRSLRRTRSRLPLGRRRYITL